MRFKNAIEILEDDWLWAFISVSVILLLARFFILRQNRRAVKGLGKDYSRLIFNAYRKDSMSGWIWICVAITACTLAVSRPDSWPSFLGRKGGLILSGFAALVGILLQLRALHLSTTAVIRGLTNAERSS